MEKQSESSLENETVRDNARWWASNLNQIREELGSRKVYIVVLNKRYYAFDTRDEASRFAKGKPSAYKTGYRVVKPEIFQEDHTIY